MGAGNLPSVDGRELGTYLIVGGLGAGKMAELGTYFSVGFLGDFYKAVGNLQLSGSS